MEETAIRTMSLPNGQDWVWYGDLNVVALSSDLDKEGRERALSELQEHWRKNCVRLDGAA